MTRTYALERLLELGPLTRKEIREITGWPENKLKFVIKGLAQKGSVECHEKFWFKRYPDGSLQTATL
jgi:hypothetical protein